MSGSNNSSDEKAFVELLIGHQPIITAYIISLLPGVSEVDDVIQNTNEVLWTKRGTFELGTNFKAWALTTARFQVMSFQRDLRKGKKVPLDDDIMESVSNVIEDMKPDSLSQQLSDLSKCISLLHIKDQELVLHRYWNKTGLKEYARATGRTISSLKSALFRVRTNLRNCLELRERKRNSLV